MHKFVRTEFNNVGPAIVRLKKGLHFLRYIYNKQLLSFICFQTKDDNNNNNNHDGDDDNNK